MNFLIKEIYQLDGRIIEVKGCRVFNGTPMLESFEMKTESLIRYLEEFGWIVFTYPRKDGRYQVGAKVIVIDSPYGKYIRSVPDDHDENNLESLPEY